MAPCGTAATGLRHGLRHSRDAARDMARTSLGVSDGHVEEHAAAAVDGARPVRELAHVEAEAHVVSRPVLHAASSILFGRPGARITDTHITEPSMRQVPISRLGAPPSLRWQHPLGLRERQWQTAIRGRSVGGPAGPTKR